MPRTRSTKSLWKDKTDQIVKRLGGGVGVQMQWSALQSERISVAPDWTHPHLIHLIQPHLIEGAPDCIHPHLNEPSTLTWLRPHLHLQTHLQLHLLHLQLYLQLQASSTSATNRFSHIQMQLHFQQLRLHKTSLATVFYGSNKLWSKCTGRTKHKSRTKYLQTSHLLPLNCNHSNNGIPHIFLEVIFCREGRLRRGELQRAKMQRVSNSSKSNFFAQLSVLKNWNTRSKKLQFLQPIFKVFVGQSVQGSRCDKHWSCFASD